MQLKTEAMNLLPFICTQPARSLPLNKATNPVDVVLSPRSLKYLYCYDTSRIKLIGVYELVNGVWSEKK